MTHLLDDTTTSWSRHLANYAGLIRLQVKVKVKVGVRVWVRKFWHLKHIVSGGVLCTEMGVM